MKDTTDRTGVDTDGMVPQEGAVIRLMGSEGVTIPLWNAGLLFDTEDQFVKFGASVQMAAEVAAWARRFEEGETGDALDLEAVRILRSLRPHFGYRYQFAYSPA